MMKRLYLLLLLLSVGVCLAHAQADSLDTEALCEELDEALARIPDYDGQRLETIEGLRQKLAHVAHRPRAEQEVNEQLIAAFYKFSYDSTYYYMCRNLELARQMGDEKRVLQMQLHKAKLYAKAGAYLEAVYTVQDIDETALSDSLALLYYSACKDVYGEAGHYSRDSLLMLQYRERASHYQARLLAMLSPASAEYLALMEARARNRREYDEALSYNDKRMERVAEMSPEYSEVAFFRSWIYRNMGNTQQEKYWLLKSAIGDVRNSVKDQASLWTLANVLAQEGDVERSYRLIRASQDGLRYYNTPLRNLQSAQVLSMIDHSYHLMIDRQNSQLRWSLGIISVLVLLLGAAVAYVFRQMKRLKAARQNLHTVNQHLTDVNGQLSQAVEELNESNSLLTDSNRIKEVYIGRFLALCSTYMKKMDAFRSAVLKKEKSGQLADFLSPARLREMKEKNVEELMEDFDKAFLHIFPTFIDDFNALLKPEGRIVPPGEKGALTTELRIFALIRLGITDSSKIAEFLHYSVHTIYNYRSVVKNAALGSRDEFENEVKKIANPC